MRRATDEGQVKERPILMSAPMVRAILDGRKTQTRRVIKSIPASATFSGQIAGNFEWTTDEHDIWTGWDARCPYGVPGDRLWVRETAWIAPLNFARNDVANILDADGRRRVVAYDASSSEDGRQAARSFGVKKTPSIHMPRWASRITLEVVNVRVERVQEISEIDAKAEGGPVLDGSYRAMFDSIWDRINAKRGYGWDKNPFVWVITFKRI